MPRDKKVIHRATSDVEDDEYGQSEEEDQENGNIQEFNDDEFEATNDLKEERKKYLKNIILKRTLALRQQRERNRQQKTGSTSTN